VEVQTAKGVDVAALVNISAEKWPPRQRTYFGSLAISSPQPGEAFAITPIHGCLGVMDLGDKRTMEFRITAREIAEDVAREINGDSGEGSYHGVFVAAGDAPTESELAEARRRLEDGLDVDAGQVHHRDARASASQNGAERLRHQRQRRHHAKLCRGCLAHHRRANRRRLRHEPRRRQRRSAVPHAVVVRLAHAVGLVVSLAAH
jgi:hypothetical protein